VPIDREATLKQAEKYLRQGKLDAAIQEYVRLVEDQPRDWNTINALGDLYVRAGNTDRAVEQFTRIADYLYAEGFFPKAAALYKKALKVHSVHEHTLERLGEIAARQGILADAKIYFRQLSEQRKHRGDRKAAAEALIRLGSLDIADADSQVAAARAAQELGDNLKAAGLLKDAAAQLEKANRRQDALMLLVDAAQLDPGDYSLHKKFVIEAVRTGELERARQFLTRDVAGDDPELLLALAQLELGSGSDQEARAVLTRVLIVAPERHAEVTAIALGLAQKGEIDRAYGCLDVVTDAALLEGDFARATGVLQAFVKDTPHVPALMKLVEVCVDAGLDTDMREAQAQLADAYLREGKGAEARVIAEDLLDHDRASEANRHRLRRALELLGVPDVDGQLAERLGEQQAVENLDVIALLENTDIPDSREVLEAIETPVPMEAPPGHEELEIPALVEAPVHADAAEETALSRDAGSAADEPVMLESFEIDLSTALADIGKAPAPTPALPRGGSSGGARREPEASAPPEPAVPSELPASPPDPKDLDEVFEGIRARVSQDTARVTEQYERAIADLREGRAAEAVKGLEAVAREPAFRFQAAARLGWLYIERSDVRTGIEWLERAAEAPAPTPDEGLAVLYKLADVLERAGETARALAILMELDADTPGYRDVRDRIDRLVRLQTGGGGGV
jgi:tetratricopeptide (TPR) repeat protein